MSHFSHVQSAQLGAVAQNQALGWVMLAGAAVTAVITLGMAAQLLDSMLTTPDGRGI